MTGIIITFLPVNITTSTPAIWPSFSLLLVYLGATWYSGRLAWLKAQRLGCAFMIFRCKFPGFSLYTVCLLGEAQLMSAAAVKGVHASAKKVGVAAGLVSGRQRNRQKDRGVKLWCCRLVTWWFWTLDSFHHSFDFLSALDLPAWHQGYWHKSSLARWESCGCCRNGRGVPSCLGLLCLTTPQNAFMCQDAISMKSATERTIKVDITVDLVKEHLAKVFLKLKPTSHAVT